jgi:hypothetical protein
LLNVQEYFAALQAVFDTVKESAWHEKYETDRAKLERNFKLYLEDKDWNNLVSFFMPYAEHFLLKFEELKETFGDGKLIKSPSVAELEDAINGLVYTLYGLNEKDVEVIDEFLRRF